MPNPLSNDSVSRQQRPRPSRPFDSAVITVNEKGRILYWSRAAQQTLGYEAAEVKGRNVSRLLDSSTADRQIARINRAIATAGTEALPLHVLARHKAGHLIDLEVAIDRWAWEGETYFSVVVSDRARGAPTAQTYDEIFITVTEILARSERFANAVPLLLRAVAEAIGWSSAAIWMSDREGKILTCRHFWPESGGALAAFRDATMSIAFLPGVGLPGRVWADGESVWVEDVLASRNFLRGIAADEADIVTALAFPIVTGREVIGVIELHSTERRVRDTSLLQLLSHVGSHIGLFLEREAATEALRVSEVTYRDLFEQNLAGVFCLDAAGAILECNAAFATMFGYRMPGELRGVLFETLLARPADWRAIASGIGVRGTMPNREVRASRRDGTVFWTLLNASSMHGVDRQRALQGTVVDIDVQKRAELEVRELVRTLNDAQQFAHVGTFERDLVDGTSRWSDEMYRLIGLDPQSPRAGYQSILDLMRPSEREEFTHIYEDAIARRVPVDLKFRLIRADGVERVLRVQARVLDDGNGRPRLTGKVLDVTDDERATEERLNLQRQLDETRRMSSLGRLAATMAHEFNNMLMGVDTAVELLRRRVVGDDAQAAVVRIQQSLTRGRRITSEILRFTRDTQPQLATIDVQRWLTHFLPEAQALTNERTVLEAEQGLYIRGDGAQLNQVLANLLINARDATPEGTPIRIVAKRAAQEGVAFANGAVDLVVIDEGDGIPRELLDRIFEPLFTTKSHGTGLGLAVVHQLITAHGGLVRVRSEIGYGTEFHLLLPLVVATHTDDLPDEVLIATEDEELRRQCCDLLGMSGVRARAFRHGVEIFIEVELATPDALILDFALARGRESDGGLDLTKLWPELPVVFLVQPRDEEEAARFAPRERAIFVRQPAAPEQVVGALRQLFRRD